MKIDKKLLDQWYEESVNLRAKARAECIAQHAEWGAEQERAKRKPLTGEQFYEELGKASAELLKLAKRWANNDVHAYQFDNEARKIINTMWHRAHGIGEDV